MDAIALIFVLAGGCMVLRSAYLTLLAPPTRKPLR